jgi:tetratricopeptide (TPR) repeat protein
MRRAVALVLSTLLALGSQCGVVSSALASPGNESKAAAQHGAEQFAKKDYLAAAHSFERAYALDAKDFRVLRYAGRAWQEVGFYDRALTLLERYVGLETDAKAKETIAPNLEKLRRATAQDKADALAAAATKYPQARLEDEAAKAYEALGDLDSIKKAVQLWEVARLSATAEADKQAIDKTIQRLRDRVVVMQDAAKAQTAAKAQSAAKADAEQQATQASVAKQASGGGGASTAQWIAWSAGGLAIAGGATMWLTGAGKTTTAHDEFKAGTTSYAQYKAALGNANTLYFTGIGLTALGVGVAAAGFVLGPARSRDTSSWRVLPALGGLQLSKVF